ncbi:MAG: hypothetical protein ACFB15_30685 [Cyclobacteriaceae bacterium]
MGILTLIAHLGWEGYQWQMVIVYVIIVCLVSSQFFSIQINNKTGKLILLVFGILGIPISSCLSYLIPVFSIPEMSGLYHVVATHESVKNELDYKVWLPTEHGKDREEGHELKSKVIISFLGRELKNTNEKIDYRDETIEWIVKPANNKS